MPAFKRDSASRLRDAERCMKGGEPLTMREASFISSLMGHAQHIDVATVRFTMHIDGSLDGQINLKSEYTRELERAERERAGTCATAAPAAAPATAPAAQSYAAAAAQPLAGSLTMRPAKRGRGRRTKPRVDRRA